MPCIVIFVNVLSVSNQFKSIYYIFDQNKVSLRMNSKEAYVAPPPSNTPFSPWLERHLSLLPAPAIQHLTPPGCHLCIGIHVCMLTFIRFGKFRLWLKKNVYRDTGPILKKSIDQNQSFFSWPIMKNETYLQKLHGYLHVKFYIHSFCLCSSDKHVGNLQKHSLVGNLSCSI